MKKLVIGLLVILSITPQSFAQRANCRKINHSKRIAPPADVDSAIRNIILHEYYPKAPDSILTASWDSIYSKLDIFTRFEKNGSMGNSWLDAILKKRSHPKLIGIHYSTLNTVIYSVAYGSPAYYAGLCANDTIIAINGNLINNSSEKLDRYIDDVDVNDTMQIQIKRGSLLYTVSVSRDVYSSSDVFAIKKHHTIYVNFKYFGKETDKDFYNAVGDLGWNNVDSIYIDIRSNGGGYASCAEKILNLFLKKGDTLCMDKTVNDSVYTINNEDSFHPLQNIKTIIIRVDNGTASAAEMLAGCLKVKRNAIIVGDTSYGKGVAQAIKHVGDHTFHVTVSEFFPGGSLKVHGVGIIPDILLKDEPISVNVMSASEVAKIRQMYPKPNSEIIRILKYDESRANMVWPNIGCLYFLGIPKNH